MQKYREGSCVCPQSLEGGRHWEESRHATHQDVHEGVSRFYSAGLVPHHKVCTFLLYISLVYQLKVKLTQPFSLQLPRQQHNHVSGCMYGYSLTHKKNLTFMWFLEWMFWSWTWCKLHRIWFRLDCWVSQALGWHHTRHAFMLFMWPPSTLIGTGWNIFLMIASTTDMCIGQCYQNVHWLYGSQQRLCVLSKLKLSFITQVALQCC